MTIKWKQSVDLPGRTLNQQEQTQNPHVQDKETELPRGSHFISLITQVHNAWQNELESSKGCSKYIQKPHCVYKELTREYLS